MIAYRILEAVQELLGYYYKMRISQNYISSNQYTECTYDNVMSFCSDYNNNIFLDYYRTNGLPERCLSYDYVGISITSSSQMLSAFTLINLIRKFDPLKKTKIFLGGNFITRMIENIDNNSMNKEFLSKVAFASVYEGEPVLYNIFDPAFDFRINDNIVFLRDNMLVRNKLSNNVYTKISICPNFDGFNLDKYFLPELVLPILSSKNCYNNCSFCTIPKGTAGNRYTQFDFKALIDNIIRLKQKYQTKNFTFNDEVFSLKRMYDFSEKLLMRGIEINWLSETRFDYRLDDNQFANLAKAGCKSIQFGLESYNQRVLDLMKKNVKIEDIDAIVEGTLKAGISIHLFCILGFPGEKEDEVKRTRDYVFKCLEKAKKKHSLPLTSIGYGTFGLEKGSDVFKNPEQYGVHILDEYKDEYDYQYDYCVDEGISQERAKEIESEMSGANPLSSLVYIPENYILCTKWQIDVEERSLCEETYIVLKNRFSIDLFTGKVLDTPKYYYHKLGEDIVLSNANKLEELGYKDKAIYFYYLDYNSKQKKKVTRNNLNKFFVNPHISYFYDDIVNSFIALDNISNRRFTLSEVFYRLLCLFKEYEIKDFIENNQKEAWLSIDKIIEIFEEMYEHGFILAI